MTLSERFYTWLLTDALNLVKIVLVAALLVKLLRWSTHKLLSHHEATSVSHRDKMIRTLASLMNNVGFVTICGLAGIMALREINLDVRPLLAGAGVLGVAIGFGAQSLVKDVVHGIFIVLEDQFGLGDTIRVGAVTGQVERMTLRRTVVRDSEGTLVTIPNSEIAVLGNLTRDWSQVSFTVSVDQNQNLDQAVKLLANTVDDLSSDPKIKPDLLDRPQILGLERFNGGKMEILMQARTKPGRQGEIGREWRRLIKLAFERAAIPVTT